jgi:crotonobetainyl-CoA:carnitine CoA-transferase CaiB-like acyl-CoA transferase
MMVDVPHEKLGRIPVTGVPFKLSQSDGEIRCLGPELGQHNQEIYGGLLGLSEREIEGLRAEDVI